MTTAQECYRLESRYMDKWPKRGEAWLFIKRWHVGHLDGWGEAWAKLPGILVGGSLREFESWNALHRSAYETLGSILPTDWEGKIIVRQFDVDEGL